MEGKNILMDSNTRDVNDLPDALLQNGQKSSLLREWRMRTLDSSESCIVAAGVI